MSKKIVIRFCAIVALLVLSVSDLTYKLVA